MSDWSMYEFQDTIWDEFHGDHIVPVTNTITNTTGDRSAPGHIDQVTAQTGFLTASKSRKRLLGKDSAPYSPSVPLPSSKSDSLSEESGLKLENNMLSRYGVQSNNNKDNSSEVCEHDATLVADNSCDNYLFDGMSNENPNLLEKTEGNDPRDCMYYNWPEIGNFEDVDMMLRNCDSTFGFEEGTHSFSSAYNMSDTVDVPEPDFKFPSFNSQDVLNIPESQYSSKSYSTNSPSMSSFRDNDNCAPENHLCFLDDGMDMFIDKEQIMEHKEKVKPQNRSLTGKASQFEVQEDGLSSGANQISFSASEFNDVEGGRQVSTTGSGSLNVTTDEKSGCSDTSTGASSFHQLQLVMEQLDLGTRLCIKDCLYRLAESADQRQKHVNLNGDCGDEQDNHDAPSGERNEITSSEDMEANTNPIDRSIAHLLFYTASESSAIHA